MQSPSMQRPDESSVSKSQKKRTLVSLHDLSMKRFQEPLSPRPAKLGKNVTKKVSNNGAAAISQDPQSSPSDSLEYEGWALRKKYLLLEEESFGIKKELLEVEDEVNTLEEERLSLLDELVVLEGLVGSSESQSGAEPGF